MSKKLVIPLFYRPADKGRGITSDVHFGAVEGDGSILITADNFVELVEDLADHGRPSFTILDTAHEARAAARAYDAFSSNPRNTTDVTRLPDGEGVMMVLHESLDLTDNDFRIEDWRQPSKHNKTIIGSWEVTLAEAEAIMSEEGDQNSVIHRGKILASHLSGIENLHVVRNTQICLDQIPGAFVGFVALSVSDIRGADIFDENDEAKKLSDADIHAAMRLAYSSEKMSLGTEEAIDCVIKTLKASYPDIFLDDDIETPAP